MNTRIENLTTEELQQTILSLKTLVKRTSLIQSEPRYNVVYDIIMTLSENLQERGITHIV